MALQLFWVLKLKSKFENEKDAYSSCVADGYLKGVFAVNKEKVRALLKNAGIAADSAEFLAKTLKKEDEKWLTVYVLYYDALRTCVEAFLLFDKIASSNHQCLFAALCVKHAEMELSWSFFETVRTKRNGANYYGERIIYADWKAVEVQTKLYISTLKKEIEKRLA